MAPPRKTATAKRTRKLEVAVSTEEMRLLAEEADRAGLSKAELLRRNTLARDSRPESLDGIPTVHRRPVQRTDRAIEREFNRASRNLELIAAFAARSTTFDIGLSVLDKLHRIETLLYKMLESYHRKTFGRGYVTGHHYIQEEPDPVRTTLDIDDDTDFIGSNDVSETTRNGATRKRETTSGAANQVTDTDENISDRGWELRDGVAIAAPYGADLHRDDDSAKPPWGTQP